MKILILIPFALMFIPAMLVVGFEMAKAYIEDTISKELNK